MPEYLERASQEARAHAAEPAQPSNRGADIDAVIGAAREKLARLDVSGATTLLDAKIAEEELARRQRIIPLLAEKATVARIAYDYKTAKAALRELLDIDADQVWSWIELGDLCVTTGSLEPAKDAFRNALDAAKKLADAEEGDRFRRRDVSVSYDRVGDVLVAQGDLPGALKSFRDGLAIARSCRARTPATRAGGATCRCPYNKVGDVLVAQGDLPGALKSFRDGLAIAEQLSRADPGNAGWRRDVSVSYAKIANALIMRGDRVGGRESLRSGRAIMARLVARHPDWVAWKQDLAWFDAQLAALEG